MTTVTKKTTKPQVKKPVEKKIELTKEEQEKMDVFNKTIEHMKKYKKVRGFIVLVDAQDNSELDKETGTGLNVACGNGFVLSNLLMNLNENIISNFDKARQIMKFKQKMKEKEKDVDELLKDMIKIISKSED